MHVRTQNLCIYPLRIEYASTKPHTSHTLCTYPPRIEYASINPIQHRIRAHILWQLNVQAQNPMQVRKEEHRTCAHILQKLNMQAHHTDFMHISNKNWTYRHGRRGRYRDGNQGHPKAKASPELEEIKMEMEDKYHPEKFEGRAPNGYHEYIYIYPF